MTPLDTPIETPEVTPLDTPIETPAVTPLDTPDNRLSIYDSNW